MRSAYLSTNFSRTFLFADRSVSRLCSHLSQVSVRFSWPPAHVGVNSPRDIEPPPPPNGVCTQGPPDLDRDLPSCPSLGAGRSGTRCVPCWLWHSPGLTQTLSPFPSQETRTQSPSAGGDNVRALISQRQQESQIRPYQCRSKASDVPEVTHRCRALGRAVQNPVP